MPEELYKMKLIKFPNAKIFIGKGLRYRNEQSCFNTFVNKRNFGKSETETKPKTVS